MQVTWSWMSPSPGVERLQCRVLIRHVVVRQAIRRCEGGELLPVEAAGATTDGKPEISLTVFDQVAHVVSREPILFAVGGELHAVEAGHP